MDGRSTGRNVSAVFSFCQICRCVGFSVCSQRRCVGVREGVPDFHSSQLLTGRGLGLIHACMWFWLTLAGHSQEK